MKKIIVFLFLFAVLPLFVFAQPERDLKVYVNDRDIHVTPLERNGVAYVPIVALAIALKIDILWDPVGSEIVVDGKKINSGLAVEKGALYVPVEAIARGIGASVDWDGEGRAIRIQTNSEHAATINDSTPIDAPLSPPEPKPPQADTNGNVYEPRTSANSDFSVTVTDVQHVHLVKDYYKPKQGDKFIVVHVSEQNISDQIQMYSGRFTLEDTDGHSYDYLEGLSNFYLQILRPGGINFGSLVFELPEDEPPGFLILNTYGNSELKVSLQ